MRPHPGRPGNAGFTLLEALLAITLMGLVVGALASVTARWLPNWNNGLFRVQRNEQVAIALDRLVADLSSAEYVLPNRTSKGPLFQGNELAVSFVRSAVGPNSRPGLEIVRLAETADRSGPMLVRMRAPFVPLPTGDVRVDPIPFADPVVLLRAPFRIGFAYADRQGDWKPAWDGSAGELPTAVRLSVIDSTVQGVLPVSTATIIHVDMAAPQPGPSNDTDQRQPGAGGGKS